MIDRTYEFIKGEAKYILSHIQPKNNSEVVVITDATYSVSHNGTIIDEGDLTIDNLTLTYLFKATDVGVFILSETVTIGAETFIEQARIIVR